MNTKQSSDSAASSAVDAPAGEVGRPEFQPTAQERGQVRLMSGYRIPQFEIARVLGISPPTLRKHFFDELEIGAIMTKTKAAQRLFQIMEGNSKEALTAAIFFLKCHAGWRDGNGGEQGKKDAQAGAARTAGQDTEWGDDLSPPAAAALN